MGYYHARCDICFVVFRCQYDLGMVCHGENRVQRYRFDILHAGFVPLSVCFRVMCVSSYICIVAVIYMWRMLKLSL